jgi:hypothetical protein
MLKRLMFWGRYALAACIAVGAITLMTYEEHKACDKYQRDCQSRVTAVPSPGNGNNGSSADECQDPKKYMPWWYVLIAWPDGITTWALLATLCAIIWQAWETRKAAQASLKSVEHSDRLAKIQREKDMARTGFSVEQPINLASDSPQAEYIISFYCPHTIFNPRVTAGAQVRTTGQIKLPDTMRYVSTPNKIEGEWTTTEYCEVVGESGIAQISGASKERLEAGEIVIVLSVRFEFSDAYWGRDAMKTWVYKATQLRNLDGTRLFTWVEGPDDLNWNKSADK